MDKNRLRMLLNEPDRDAKRRMREEARARFVQNGRQRVKAPSAPFENANRIIGLLTMFGCFFWILTLPLTFTLMLISALINGLLGICSKLVRKFQKGRPVLLVMRTLGIAAAILTMLPSLLILGFDHTPLLYKAKRFAFTRGVHTAALYREILPEELPNPHSDYTFLTQGQFIAQDYSPSCYLMLHTDEETLSRIEREFIPQISWLVRFDPPELDEEAVQSAAALDPDDRFTVYCPELAGHAAARLWHAGFRADLTGAVVWRTQNAPYSKGIMIHRESGTLLIWT